jgi:hypothetical protein
MNTSSSFVPNPCDVNQVLMVLPGQFYVYFIPKSRLHLPGQMNWDKTMMVLGDQAFTLLGDYRSGFQHALELGGIVGCIRLYQHLQEHAACPWTSRSDPWAIFVRLAEVPVEPAVDLEDATAVRCDHAALAA